MWRGILFVACLVSASGMVAPTAYAAHQASVKAELVLDHTSVRAGTSIKGTWLFTDTTARPILVDACAQDIWHGTWLQSKQLPAVTDEPGTPVVRCRPSVHLAPGVNRFPVTVPTVYGTCSPPRAGSRAPTPACLPTGRLPPLPPGTYVTRFLMRGMPAGFRQPATLAVRLLAPRDLPAGSGELIGTATPCIGQALRYGVSQTWTVQVALRRGSDVVGRRVLTDTWEGNGPMVDQPFRFIEPAGSYAVVTGSGRTDPVVIRPGTTTVATFPDRCL